METNLLWSKKRDVTHGGVQLTSLVQKRDRHSRGSNCEFGRALMKLMFCQDSEAEFNQNCCKKLLYDQEEVTLGSLCI